VVTDEEARAHLHTLANSGEAIYLGPVGFAAAITDEFKAYEALTEDRAALARLEPDLSRLVRTGAPGAVLYAALLLKRLDRDVTADLAPYRDDRRQVTVWPGGCVPMAMWLAEAARWVEGEHWQHPEHAAEFEQSRRAARFESIKGAKWFELPSARDVERKRSGGQPADLEGAWTHAFLDIVTGPAEDREEHRAAIDALVTEGSPVARLYGALIVRVEDPAAAERVLDELARSGHKMSCLRKKSALRALASRLLDGWAYEIVQRPAADVVAEARAWSHGS
jgi:hypothetical protein